MVGTPPIFRLQSPDKGGMVVGAAPVCKGIRGLSGIRVFVPAMTWDLCANVAK